MTAPKSLIINSPYEAPRQHWAQTSGTVLTIEPKRRPAGYEIFDIRNNTRRADLARLSNVGGEMVSSLDAQDDLKRKLFKMAA